MFRLEGAYVAYAGGAIDLLTGVVIGYHVGWALWLILRRRGTDAVRVVIADGVLVALGFGVAGSLLKTLALQDWVTIRTFAFLFVFRTLLKRVFEREQRVVLARGAAQGLSTQ